MLGTVASLITLLVAVSVIGQTDAKAVQLSDTVIRQVVAESLRREVVARGTSGTVKVAREIGWGSDASSALILQESWLPKIKGVDWELISNRETNGNRETAYYFFGSPKRLINGDTAMVLAFGDLCRAGGLYWQFRVVKGRVVQFRPGNGFGMGCASGSGTGN